MRSAWRPLFSACSAWLLAGCGAALSAQPDGEQRDEVAQQLDELCAESGGEACFRAGQRYERGAWTQHGRERSLVVYGKGCDGGDAKACAALARLYGSDRLGEPQPARAAALHLRACEGGQGPSCGVVGKLHLTGAAGMKRDLERAAALWARGCEAADAASCAELARLKAHGRGVAPDLVGARRLYDRACTLGQGQACFELAMMMRLGIGGERSPAPAMEPLLRGCELESADACAALARTHRDGEGDPAERWSLNRRAASVFERSCSAGDPHSCSELGRMLRAGDGIGEDRGRGLELQRDACRRGHGPACIAFVRRGWHRIGIDKEPAGAAALVRACQQLDGAACFALGWLGQDGVRRAGVAPLDEDPFARGCQAGHAGACNAAGIAKFPADETGLRWLQRACERGHAPGCHHLGLVLELRDDDDDVARAATVQGRACQQGYAPGCTRLGLMQRRGHGVPFATHEASASFKQGCDLGAARACFERGRLLQDSGGDAVSATPYFERACRGGYLEGCTRHGINLLRGRGIAADLAAAKRALEGSCGRRSLRACLALTDEVGKGELAVALQRLRQVTEQGEAVCADGLAMCRHHLPSSRVQQRWRRWGGEPTLVIIEQPACGEWLERACLDAREVRARRCELASESCFEAAQLAREHARAGLSSSVATAESLEKKGFEAARRGCAAGEVANCERLAAAYAQGRGTTKNERLAKRYAARACKLDAAHCPAKPEER